MSDNKEKRGPQDAKLISLKEKWEVEYWTDALGVDASELAQAVQEVGHSAAAVREHLQSVKRKPR